MDRITEYVIVDARTKAVLRHVVIESNVMRSRMSKAWIELYIPNCFLNGLIITISMTRASRNAGAML